MNRFTCWVADTPTAKLNALLGAAVFALTAILVGIQSAIAFGVHVHSGRVIVVPDVWVDILDSMLIASATWATVSLGALIGKRATTNPKVIDAEARARNGVPPNGGV